MHGSARIARWLLLIIQRMDTWLQSLLAPLAMWPQTSALQSPDAAAFHAKPAVRAQAMIAVNEGGMDRALQALRA